MSIAKKVKTRTDSTTSTKKVAVRRQRRQPDEVRSAALESARQLLLTKGPDAITLKAVADDLGMTHTNLLHHFGSASGLQSALMRDMVSTLTSTLEAAVVRFRAGAGDVEQFVDIVFDTFDKGGAGKLAAWMSVSGNDSLLAPVGEVVQAYIRNVEKGAHLPPDQMAVQHERFTSTTLLVVISAFGDAIIGENMHGMVERERGTLRALLRRLLPELSALTHERQVRSA